jgi:hypothetical protein
MNHLQVVVGVTNYEHQPQQKIKCKSGKNVVVIMDEKGMQKKNVGTYILAVSAVLKIMIITSVGIEKFQRLAQKSNVVG